MAQALRKRRRRVTDVQAEDTENIPILDQARLDALNNELPPNGEARKVRC